MRLRIGKGTVEPRDVRYQRVMQAFALQLAGVLALFLAWAVVQEQTAVAALYGGAVIVSGNLLYARRLLRLGVVPAPAWLWVALVGEGLKLVWVLAGFVLGLTVLALTPWAIVAGATWALLLYRLSLFRLR